jgi:uncharacterized phage infection (PIP) family protein YhgE
MISQINAIAQAIPGIVRGINLLSDKLNTIQKGQETIMSELDDLKAAMTSLTTAVATGTAEVSALVAKVLALLGAPAGVDPVAVEAVATQLQAQADAINAAVADAKTKAGV